MKIAKCVGPIVILERLGLYFTDMTLFGKTIFGVLAVALIGAVFYGVGSYVSYDGAPTPLKTESVATTTVMEPTSVATTTTEASSTKPTGKKIPFAQFLNQGGSHMCTVNQTIGTVTSEGTVYIHDSFVMANFSTTLAGHQIDSTMVIRDGYIYSWTSASQTTGVKVKMLTAQEQESASASQTVRSWNPNQVGDYSCKDWVADDTKFTLPKTIVFTEAK
jgi:hypothetical protein